MKHIYILLGIGGFLFLLGTAGGADVGSMDMQAIAVRGLIGLGLIGFSYLGIRCCEDKAVQKRYEQMRRRRG